MLPRQERILLDSKERRISWKDQFPPDLDPEHPIIFEYADDQDGQEWCFWYDAEEAARFVNFAPENCVFIEGDSELVGTPINFLEWQKLVTRELFGWKVVENGQLTNKRRYQTCYVLIPKKNNKTTGGVIWSLALAELDEFHQAQNYYSAFTEEQGGDAGWRIMQAMVRHENSKLRERYVPWEDVIDHTPSGSVIRLVGGSSKGKSGKNVHSLVADEYWEFPDKKMIKQFRTGMVAQTNPMLILLSTSGDDMTVPAYKEYEMCKLILSGDYKNPHYLPVIFEPPKGANWHDRKVWQMVNPGWGVTVNKDTLEQIYLESIGSPTDEAEFQQFHLNIWSSGAQDFIRDQEWQACAAEFTLEDLIGKYCVGGIDFAATKDMNAFDLWFPEWTRDEETGEWIIKDLKILPFYWCPELINQERKNQGFKYPEWVQMGLLRETEGDIADRRQIRRDIKEIAKLLKVRGKLQIGYDRYLAGSEDLTAFQEDGFEMIEIPQTMPSLGPVTDEFERLVLSGRIKHNNHEILNWNVANAKVVKDGKGNKMVSKTKSKKKIDGLAAGLNGLKLVLSSPRPKEKPKLEFW